MDFSSNKHSVEYKVPQDVHHLVLLPAKCTEALNKNLSFTMNSILTTLEKEIVKFIP